MLYDAKVSSVRGIMRKSPEFAVLCESEKHEESILNTQVPIQKTSVTMTNVHEPKIQKV